MFLCLSIIINVCPSHSVTGQLPYLSANNASALLSTVTCTVRGWLVFCIFQYSSSDGNDLSWYTNTKPVCRAAVPSISPSSSSIFLFPEILPASSVCYVLKRANKTISKSMYPHEFLKFMVSLSFLKMNKQSMLPILLVIFVSHIKRLCFEFLNY